MATAKPNVETKVLHTVKDITLVLTPREAVSLHLILANVAGSPYNSLRGEAQAIYQSLNDVGIITYPERDNLGISGTITCEPPTDEAAIDRILEKVKPFDIETFDTPELQALMRSGVNAIAWIKMFRELTHGMQKDGEFVGLKEAKDEHDRRKALQKKFW